MITKDGRAVWGNELARTQQTLSLLPEDDEVPYQLPARLAHFADRVGRILETARSHSNQAEWQRPDM